jgi:GTPase SAR1 family protein
MVAIVGPQRVGKSTLVNALLGVDVSPVADYPTTAVPLLFDSGERAQAEIVFAGGERKVVPATSKALQPYAAHQENDENRKGIQMIRVTLPNDMLARGVSLVDTPGLHDASAVVRQVTKAAIDNADAILFVLDASLGAKFKLGQAEIEDLAALQHSKERVIVVLNQADGLPETGRPPLSAYVESQLKKHGIWNGLPVHPLFASGREGWGARLRNVAPPTSFRILEDELWGHLLKNRGTGMHRLGSAVNRLGEACETGEALLSERADKGSQAGELERARRTCRTAIEQADIVARAWNVRVRRDIAAFLEDSNTRRTSAVAAEVEKVPLDGVFPSADQLHDRVQKEVLEEGQAIWAVLQRETASITKDLGDIVQKALKESRAQLGIPLQVRMSVSARAMPPIDLSLPEEGVGLLGGVLGFLANPAIGFVTTILGWIIGRDVALQKRRVRVMATIQRRYGESLHDGLVHLGVQASERLSSTAAGLVHQVQGRLETFMADAQRRIDRLGSPLSDEDAARLRHFAVEMRRIREEAELVARELDGVLGDSRGLEAA